MKIIFLNAWYAKAGKVFYDFITGKSAEADAFCLNEVYPEMFFRLKRLLPDFWGFYEQGGLDRAMGFNYGQAVFVRRKIKARSLGKINIYRNVYNDPGYAISFNLNIEGKTLFLLNVHGKARPGHKLDTPARIRQSKKIIDFLKDKKGPKIIGGDFNLMPETKSIKMFEEAGYRNLIKEFAVKSTRNRLAWEQFPNEEKQYFADYVFVSPELKVTNFSVPKIEISDHLPLILDFEI